MQIHAPQTPRNIHKMTVSFFALERMYEFVLAPCGGCRALTIWSPGGGTQKDGSGNSISRGEYQVRHLLGDWHNVVLHSSEILHW